MMIFHNNIDIITSNIFNINNIVFNRFNHKRCGMDLASMLFHNHIQYIFELGYYPTKMAIVVGT